MKSTTLLLLLGFISGNLPAQTYPDKIGMGLGGIGGFAMEFADATKTMVSFGGQLDTANNPMHDFTAMVFDMRPCCPWIGSVDDPDKFVPKLMSGTYKIQFNGKAKVTNLGDPVIIQNLVYDITNNLTTIDLIVQRNNWLVNLNFSNTQRTSASATNTGITNFKLLRPGYHNRPNDIYRQEYINAISHFPVIRFMDFINTNNNNPVFPGKTEWANRQLPEKALFNGITPWEYVIRLANITGKDIWINIPVAASDDYVAQLAKMINDSLVNPGTKIYIEYSNEVWNGGFTQYSFNKEAAINEVKTSQQGGTPSKLSDEAGQCDKNDTTLWCGRRYVKRLKEIGDIFVETFSPGTRASFGTRIRPVFAWQIGGWIPYYSCILSWFEYAYGAGSAKNCFYGLAGAAYVNAEDAPNNASVEDILNKMMSNSDAGRGSKRDNPTNWLSGTGKIGLKEIADIFSLKLLQYETGPDNGGGNPTNVINRIAANRANGMKDVIIQDLKNNWFADTLIAGDLVMYFVLCSSYNRYGCWGSTEEIENMHTPKLQAIYAIAGIAEDKIGPSQPSNVQVSMIDKDALITWEAATDNVGVTHYRISDNTGALATILANETLSVTLKNYNQANLNTLKVTAVDAFNNISGFNLSTALFETDKPGIIVFPNPADATLYINTGNESKKFDIYITDILGKEMIYKHTWNENIAAIDISGLQRGIYIIRIEEDSLLRVVKIIKQ